MGQPVKKHSAGERFGRLTVSGHAGSIRGRATFAVVCDCGARLVVLGKKLRNGNTKSCGCLRHDRQIESATKHGLCGTPTYRAWMGMHQRCGNAANPAWVNYGGRGIRVSEKWATFTEFLAAMGEAPRGMSLDRIDNSGNYEPGNCRWATRNTQARNSRRAKLNSEAAKVIRHLKHVNTDLMAALHGVARSSIVAARNGTTWGGI